MVPSIIVLSFLPSISSLLPFSQVCMLLIVNDLVDGKGGITEPRPDLGDADACAAFVNRHSEAVLKAAILERRSRPVKKSHAQMIRFGGDYSHERIIGAFCFDDHFTIPSMLDRYQQLKKEGLLYNLPGDN